MSDCTIELDKNPGVYPFGVGETWKRFFQGCTEGHGTRSNHGVSEWPSVCRNQGGNWRPNQWGSSSLWPKIVYRGMGFLLVDAKKAFNENNQAGMLWKVWHLWLSGAPFVFNCYRHWSLLVLWNGNGTASIIHSRDGMMQGYHIAMISYGIGILPLIKTLKRAIPDGTQPWYADDSGALGTFARVETYIYSLTRQGLERGYHPELSKSVLIVRPENIEARKVFGRCHGFKVFRGARYLGGYIGDEESKHDWSR